MTEPERPGAFEGNADAEELGAPVEAIAALEYRTAPGFLRRVHQRIHRRVLGRHVAGFAWAIPALVFLSFLDVLVGVFWGHGTEKGDTVRWNR